MGAGGGRGTYVLVYQHNRDILPLLRELIKGPLNRTRFRLLVYDEVVLLAVGRVGDVLDARAGGLEGLILVRERA